VRRYNQMSSGWWLRKGPMRALHDINPVRAAFIASRTVLHGRKVLDAGCGGGLLCEAMARRGASVTGIDLSPGSLAEAADHAQKAGLRIAYRTASPEELALETPGAFDIVTCMELLEHVPEPGALVAACSRLARPGGDVFFATLNRTAAARILAVHLAERLGVLARGTHDPDRFVRPAELRSWSRHSGLRVLETRGMLYVPFLRICRIVRWTGVNYLMHCKRPGGAGVLKPDH
jgi:2-polyprenyl-6-hydroxyphenyl methylase/3-demethylubiquinone-9 3-methyltransferase